MSDGPFDTILVDLDGVLRHWPATDGAIETRFGLPEGAIRAEAFSSDRLDGAIRGRVTDAEWRRGVAEALRERHPAADAFAAVREWSAGTGTIDRDVLALLLRHEPPGGIVLFTNATSRLGDDLEALSLTGVFRAVVNSSEVGSIKPEPEAFRAAIRACGGEAGRIVYVDDAPGNVEAGRAAGVASHLHRTDASLEGFLREPFPSPAGR